ncbi:MAG TPA: hypothetical protein VLW45_11700 [Pelomicrobium sp.]|nr:hypothetical protein [Pelomicrobium sp.]
MAEPAARDFERTDVSPLRILSIGAVLLVILGLILGGLWLLRHHLLAEQGPTAAPRHLERELGAVPPPRLLPEPVATRAARLASDRARLESYGWSGDERDAAHIPIDAAIDALLDAAAGSREEKR